MQDSKLWDIVPGYEFVDELDLKDLPTWLLDVSHSWPPMQPLSAWYWMHNSADGNTYSFVKFNYPWCRALENRFRNGASYISAVAVTDEEEINRRQAIYMKSVRPYFMNFNSWWSKARSELMRLYQSAKNYDVEKANSMELYAFVDELGKINRRMWEIHGMGFGIIVDGWVVFDMMCKEMFDLSDSHPEFQKLVCGYSNKIQEVDRKLWQLAQLAINSGLSDEIMKADAKDILNVLEKSEPGKKWIKAFKDFLNEDGWRMQHMHVLEEPIWIEEPSPAIWAVKGYIAKGGDFSLDKIRIQLANERKKVEKKYMKKVPLKKKLMFMALLKHAQRAGSFNEEHTYYCEAYCHAVMHHAFLKIGKRFAEAGAIEQPQDIFFLIPDEIKRAIHAPQSHHLSSIVDSRRKQWLEWHNIERPPMLTTRATMQEAFADIMAARLAGAKVAAGEIPVVRPELNADLYGICGSPGETEGVARVVKEVDQLGEVQPGEILVAPSTSTSWTPIFAIIKGAVIDRGGALAHAAVVGREYGIPVILNVFEGTTKIKTGQKIKVNATDGLVYIVK